MSKKTGMKNSPTGTTEVIQVPVAHIAVLTGLRNHAQPALVAYDPAKVETIVSGDKIKG